MNVYAIAIGAIALIAMLGGGGYYLVQLGEARCQEKHAQAQIKKIMDEKPIADKIGVAKNARENRQKQDAKQVSASSDKCMGTPMPDFALARLCDTDDCRPARPASAPKPEGTSFKWPVIR